ncbi:zinc transporter ZntB [Amylibacter sp.]|nr:zinc transporter ZntB [Amylibacter sp.]
MSSKLPEPICAFLIYSDGKPVSIPLPKKLDDFVVSDGYIWLHFNVTELGFETWLERLFSRTVASAMIEPETRPRCDQLENGLILNLRGVNLNPGADPDDMVSLRLWVTEKLILSARVRKLISVDAIKQKIESGIAPISVVSFLNELAFELTKRIEKVSLTLVERADTIEEDAFSPKKMFTGELATLRQSVIKLRRFIRPQSIALAELAEGKVLALDPQSASMLRETTNRSIRTVEELDTTSDRLQALQDHLDMLSTSALGRNSYVLSVVAAIFLPLGFLTGLFGVNVGGMPLVDSHYGFMGVTVGSALIGIVLFLVFRQLKWL